MCTYMYVNIYVCVHVCVCVICESLMLSCVSYNNFTVDPYTH